MIRQSYIYKTTALQTVLSRSCYKAKACLQEVTVV